MQGWQLKSGGVDLFGMWDSGVFNVPSRVQLSQNGYNTYLEQKKTTSIFEGQLAPQNKVTEQLQPKQPGPHLRVPGRRVFGLTTMFTP